MARIDLPKLQKAMYWSDELTLQYVSLLLEKFSLHILKYMYYTDAELSRAVRYSGQPFIPRNIVDDLEILAVFVWQRCPKTSEGVLGNDIFNKLYIIDEMLERQQEEVPSYGLSSSLH